MAELLYRPKQLSLALEDAAKEKHIGMEKDFGSVPPVTEGLYAEVFSQLEKMPAVVRAMRRITTRRLNRSLMKRYNNSILSGNLKEKIYITPYIYKVHPSTQIIGIVLPIYVKGMEIDHDQIEWAIVDCVGHTPALHYSGWEIHTFREIKTKKRDDGRYDLDT